MAATKHRQAPANTAFAKWLDTKIGERCNGSVRQLAREMLGSNGHTPLDRHTLIEQNRRLIHRSLRGSYPNEQNRERIADALGVPKDEIPSDDDEEESALTLDQIMQIRVEQAVSKALAEVGLA